MNIITRRAERLSTIQAMPEASLLVPGSQVLIQAGAGPISLGLGTSSDAFTYKVLGTNQTPAAILTFYSANLARRGWSGPRPTPSAFDATIAKAWQRGHYVLAVDILGPQSRTYPGEDQSATAYVIEVRYSRTCHQHPPRRRDESQQHAPKFHACSSAIRATLNTLAAARARNPAAHPLIGTIERASSPAEAVVPEDRVTVRLPARMRVNRSGRLRGPRTPNASLPVAAVHSIED